MKILIVDRDALVAGMVQSKLEGMGHDIIVEPSKDEAMQIARQGDFDLVFIDPAPLTDARQPIFNLRRNLGKYPYIVLFSKDAVFNDALKSGANDVLTKPVDPKALQLCVDNAAFMTALVDRIGDDREDFPSAGGVIAKSAFNQLFLSSLERSDRYAEKSFVLFIGIENHQEILEMDGAHAAVFAAATLSQYLARLRRQSDILAQTGRSEFALLLQRPIYESEPVEAANRFAQALSELHDIASNGVSKAAMHVTLVSVPTGAVVVSHDVVIEA